MAITYRSISSASKLTTTTGSFTLNAPAGATTDDLLVACIMFRGGTTPSIPSTWNIINRTQVTGNTNTNNAAIGSGLMAWTKVSGTVDYVFGAVSGEQFVNIAFGYVVRIDGQDLTDPVAGTSVNTLSTGSNGLITTGGYTRSFATDIANDYIEIMLCMGGQEGSGNGPAWNTQEYTTGSVAMTELVDDTTTSGADGSAAVARSTTVGDTTGGFDATATLSINARSSLMVASFGGPRPAAAGYSFSTFF